MDRGGAYVVVGRSRDCDLVLEHETVSGRHARLSWDGDRLTLEDLGSSNGTFVDGRQVARAKIRPGDEIVLGHVALPWSEEPMRAFLRRGPRRTTVRSRTLLGRPIGGRRFACGACHARGLLPRGFTRGELVCGACQARLELGDGGAPRRWGLALLGAGALAAGMLSAIAITIAPARAETAWHRIGRALGLRAESPPIAASSAEEASIRSRIAPRVAASIDPTHPRTRNLAVRIASSNDGPFHVEQAARIWAHVRQSWRYVSDPRGGEYFAHASETIENGMAGDCDDFATVIIAMIQSIGGQARMVMVDGDEGGHAYAEVCIDAPAREVAQRLARFYGSGQVPAAAIEDIHFRSDDACPVWLNLDWNARVPGGPYGHERWAVGIHPDGHTETLAAAVSDAPLANVPRLVPATAP